MTNPTNLLQFTIQIEDGEEPADRRVIKVPLAVPASDFPNSVNARLDPANSSLTLMFDYSTSSEGRITETLNNSTLIYGEKTGRIYEITLLRVNASKPDSYSELSQFVQRKRKELTSASRPRMANNLELGSIVLRQLDERTQHFVNLAYAT